MQYCIYVAGIKFSLILPVASVNKNLTVNFFYVHAYDYIVDACSVLVKININAIQT